MPSRECPLLGTGLALSSGGPTPRKFRIVGVLKQWSGGKGDKGAIPFATACGMYFFELGVGQSTVMRVPAVVPVTSNIGVPVPKTLVGPKSLK
jgi:hypothetical protein